MIKNIFQIIEDNLLPWKFFIHESKKHDAIEWIKKRSIPWKIKFIRLMPYLPEPQCLNVSNTFKILRWYGKYSRNRAWVLVYAINHKKTLFLTILSPIRIIFCVAFYLFFSLEKEAFFFSLIPSIYYFVFFQNEYYDDVRPFLNRLRKEV
ncbi:Hypothetical protein LBF_2190 [Leptospira biflexa serovar Patoc strain 'Patoc 1 (Ames)']|nr:Hypothetical protein LBF_2167 [Leptospira biflexa serovar Patoc strain 'Patoc 1 (Ames)']ABZ94687.1 Hypothetical protein LBF_2190 [Leptospira biflexa serovar Patoc strain 'Patoc 1 (Ames)']